MTKMTIDYSRPSKIPLKIYEDYFVYSQSFFKLSHPHKEQIHRLANNGKILTIAKL